MSYDLLFAARNGKGPIARENFIAHFSARPNYTLNGEQAWYENEDTGVYFSFEYDPQTQRPDDWDEFFEEGEEKAEWRPSTASFNINFNRPFFFALEAAPEIAAFVDACDLVVDDPQGEGEEQSAFAPNTFIANWDKSNTWACSALRESGDVQVPHNLPRQALVDMWSWNLHRSARQAEVGEYVFIPKMSLGLYEGAVHTFVVWPDAIPEFIPQVDLLFVVRDQLRKRKWFGAKTDPETVLVPWTTVEPLLARFPRELAPAPHYALTYDDAPSEVVEFVKSQGSTITSDSFRALAPDSVLDSEYLRRGV